MTPDTAAREIIDTQYETITRLRAYVEQLRDALQGCIVMFATEDDPEDDWTAIKRAHEALKVTEPKP